MREKYRKSIASLNKFPQFTTMNVIDGQAGLVIYSSLIFYSLTIDNILNIIVLLILAGVTIATLTGENGILIQAENAKENTEIATEEVVERAATSAKIGDENLIELEEGNLKEQLDLELGEEKTEVSTSGEYFLVVFQDSKRAYIVDKDGNVKRANWWTTTDNEGNNKITNGEITLTIGDYINYNPIDNGTIETYISEESQNGVKDQEFSSDVSTGGWRVLGVDYIEDDGSLILISANSIKATDGAAFSLNGAWGYKNGETELHNICEIFGNGEGSIRAKSIEMDDINKITGYDPMDTGDGKKYKEGKFGEYNNHLTFVKDGGWHWSGTSTNGTTWGTDYAFRYINEETGVFSSLDKIGDTYSAVNSYYYYSPITLTESNEGETKGIRSDSKEYSMLFGYDKDYWIATKYIYCPSNSFLQYGMFRTSRNFQYFLPANPDTEFTGSGQPEKYRTISQEVRPIVYLDSNISLESSGNKINSLNEWNIKI